MLNDSDETSTQEQEPTPAPAVKAEVEPTVSYALTSDVSTEGSADKADNDVIRLIMAYPDDTFHYGDKDDEVLDGRKPKEFLRAEGERILDLAIKSNAHVLVREGDDN